MGSSCVRYGIHKWDNGYLVYLYIDTSGYPACAITLKKDMYSVYLLNGD